MPNEIAAKIGKLAQFFQKKSDAASQKASSHQETLNPVPEIIHIGDPLPPEYSQPLETVRNAAPEGFRDQAEMLAYIFWALDHNRKLVDKDGTSLDALAEAIKIEITALPSIRFVYFMHNLRTLGTKSPEATLPSWVISTDYEQEVNEQGVDGVVAFYSSWANQYGSPEKRSNGDYYIYPASMCPEAGRSQADNFKCYIEKDADVSSLEAAFHELANSKLHPHQSKLFEEDRLVLYWGNFPSADITTSLKSIFAKHNIQVRGFGQDSIQAVIKPDHSWEFETRSSNDQARGEAGGSSDFYKNDYSPRRFFELYIQQMFRHCRNPLNPYRMSFVPVVDASNGIHDKVGLEKELEKIRQEGLDVQYFQGRIHLLFS